MTSYSFDKNGNLSTITYPSGRKVTYAVDAADRISSVTTTKGAATQTLASSVAHKPFGGISSMTYGNSLARTVGYDQQYRISSIVTGAVQNLSYSHDPNGNITAIANVLNPTKNKTFTYDALDRLTGGTGPWGSLAWTYDGVGNRMSQVENGATSTYSYQSGTNKLTGVSGAATLAFSFDANGNTTTENAKTFTYNQNNRLIKASESGTTKGTYTFNASGQRATKKTGSAIRVFHHDQQGNLIAETSSAGATIAEYIHLDGQPLAKLDSGGTRYILPDHLGTPQIMTNASKAIVWQIEAKPFGDGASITGSAILNFRFPGQYYDGETGLHQNWFRDYMPKVGRYVEPDPLGILKGTNHLYRYARANPIIYVDHKGLFCKVMGSNTSSWIEDHEETVYGDWIFKRYHQINVFCTCIFQRSYRIDVTSTFYKHITRLLSCLELDKCGNPTYTFHWESDLDKFVRTFSRPGGTEQKVVGGRMIGTPGEGVESGGGCDCEPLGTRPPGIYAK